MLNLDDVKIHLKFFSHKSQLLFNPSLVLVQPRKTCPYITERLLMGRKESNQINKQNNFCCMLLLSVYVLGKPILQTIRTQIRLLPREQSDLGS